MSTMDLSQSLVACLFLVLCSQIVFAAKECEVCVKVLGKLQERLPKDANQKTIETELKSLCENLKISTENRFCYYIGGLETSATTMISHISKPLSFHKPVEKICKDLNTRDSQICELKYEEQIDLCKVDLKKLKIKDLKKVLAQLDTSCQGCIEKSEFIKRIEEVKPDCPKQEL